MKPVPFSKMEYRVAIQSRTLSADSYGGPVATWTTEATRWGQITPLSGRELWQAQQVRPDVTHQVALRYYDGLKPRHRLLVEGRTFQIQSVVDLENRHRQQVCICVEEVT